MSLTDYNKARELDTSDLGWTARVMLAMRKADTDNLERLAFAFPLIYDEFITRYNAPGGLLPEEITTVPSRKPERLWILWHGHGDMISGALYSKDGPVHLAPDAEHPEGATFAHMSSSLGWLVSDLTTGFSSRRERLKELYPDGYEVVAVTLNGVQSLDELPEQIRPFVTERQGTK